MFIIISILMLALAQAFSPGLSAVWLLAMSQLVMLFRQIRTGNVTGVGAFLFMSFLFFGVRPIYIVLEKDYLLFTGLFNIKVNMESLIQAMTWGTLAMIAFAIGAAISEYRLSSWLRRQLKAHKTNPRIPLISDQAAQTLLFLQLLSLPVIYYLATAGRALYTSSFGAYAYELPVPLQAGHLFAVVALLERYRQRRGSGHLIPLCISVLLFLYFTWLMREISMFRGFYLAGVMIAGIAVLQRLRPRVSYLWLILPIILAQPLFRELGGTRQYDNATLAQIGLVERSFGEGGLKETYWNFYNARGDMNIFDTFTAALDVESKLEKQPYALSWLYVPFHFVPRALWKGKPERGILQDLSFMNGAPFSPGIAGFFLLDGGRLWMLACMALLGAIIRWMDFRVYALPDGYLKACLIGIVTVNAMFLTRFLLWQWFYQLLYAVIPCIILARWLGNRSIPLKAMKTRSKRSAP